MSASSERSVVLLLVGGSEPTTVRSRSGSVPAAAPSAGAMAAAVRDLLGWEPAAGSGAAGAPSAAA